MKLLKNLLYYLKPKAWIVRRCCWPYPEGYATYNRFTNTILDTGLSKQEAEETCRELNK